MHADVHMYRDAEVPRKAAEADAVVLLPGAGDRADAGPDRHDPVPAGAGAGPVRHRRPDLRSGAPARAGPGADQGRRAGPGPVLAGHPPLPDHPGGRRRLHRLHRDALRPGHRADRHPLPPLANGVGRQLARVCDFELYRPRKSGPVRIGYLSGTNTHNEDWAFVEPAIAAGAAPGPTSSCGSAACSTTPPRSPRSTAGSAGCRSSRGTNCPPCCAIWTSTWPRWSRTRSSTSRRAPSSGWRRR